MVDARDPLNAFVAGPVEDVKPAGSGLLGGWSVGVKDDVDVAGFPTRSGSRLTSWEPAGEDALLVGALRGEGAGIVGKTNLCEFALFAVTDNAVTGPTLNPWDPTRTPGGSSGGSAVAVATGLADAAIGTDAGGSVRIPAAFTGTVGFKPTRGRVPHEPSVIYGEREHPGFLSGSVEDARVLLEATQRSSGSLGLESPEGVRVGWSLDLGFATVAGEVERVAREVVRSLKSSAATVVQADVDLPNPGPVVAASTAVEARAFLEDRFPGWREEVWRPTEALVDAAPGNVDDVREEMVDLERETTSRLAEVFHAVDVLVTPTTAVPPFPSRQLGVEQVRGVDVGPLGWMPFTVAFNLTGGPAVSVPAGTTSAGLPVGVQVAGPPGRDEVVLGVARELETRLG